MNEMTIEKLDLNPPRAVAEMPLYERIGWKPHDGQKKVICSFCRSKVVAAGRRFGKSEIGGHKLVQESLNTRLVKTKLEDLGKRREFWIVGPSYTDSEKEFRIMWNELKKMGLEEYFDKPGSYNDPVGGSMHLSMWEGLFQVHAKSEKHPDSLVGEGLSGAIFAEAAKLKERTYNKLIRPTLADFNGWSLFTSTPEGKNWFYELWKRGQDPTRPDWSSFRMPSWMNPYVYPMGASDAAIAQLHEMIRDRQVIDLSMYKKLGIDPEIGELAADLTQESFNQEIGADFTEFVGRVFKSFDEETHVGDFTYDPTWATYAAVDYGFTNPNVWLLIQVDPHNERVRVLDEVYESGLTAEEFAAEIIAKGLAPRDLRSFFPDPADPGSTRTLEQKLRVRHKGGTGGELRWRIDAIRGGLKMRNPHLPEEAPERVPSLQIDRKCEKTIADFLNYRYADKKKDTDGSNKPENPQSKDDHGPEALGRFYAGHFGTPDKILRRARARKSNMAA